jgi:2-phospho-L-lactate transferase/gluconeogenesis factor (CofD/UPF0052 family)
MTQPGETDGYTASTHARAILSHAGKIIDYVIINREMAPEAVRERYSREGAVPVIPDIREIEKMGLKVAAEQLLAGGEVVRHSSDKLARLVLSFILKK